MTAPLTRKQHAEIVAYLFETIGFEKETREKLVDTRKINSVDLLTLLLDEDIRALSDDGDIKMGEKVSLRTLVTWLKGLKSQNIIPKDIDAWTETVNKTTFSDYCAKQVQASASAKVQGGTTLTTTTTVRLSDYEQFNGRSTACLSLSECTKLLQASMVFWMSCR